MQPSTSLRMLMWASSDMPAVTSRTEKSCCELTGTFDLKARIHELDAALHISLLDIEYYLGNIP